MNQGGSVSLRHSEKWYHDLSVKLGHRGYVTLAEIKQAEAGEAS